MTTSLGLALGLLLAGFQTAPDDWANWGDTRSAIEYSSLLSGWSINPKNNRLTFETKLPLVAVYVPTSPRKFLLKAELWKAGGAKKEHSWDFEVAPNPSSYPFLKVSSSDRPERSFAFTQAGDYELRFWARDPIVPQGKYITRLAFTVDLLDDSQRPKPLAVLSGPWDDWAYLWFPYGKRETGRPEVRIWRRADLKTPPEGDQYAVKILKNNVLLGSSEPQTVKDFEHARLSFPLTTPENLGGSELLAKDLLTAVGEYHVLVEKNGKLDAAYSFEVEHRARFVGTQFSNEPMFKFHANQRPIESVHEDFIVPRMPGDAVEREGAGDTLWMERMSNVKAALVFNRTTPPAIVQNPVEAPLVKPAIVTEPMVPVEPMPKEEPMPREVASVTPMDTEKAPRIPMPQETTPEPSPTVPEASETTPKPQEESKTSPPSKRSTRDASGEELGTGPNPEPPSIWETHLGLIATVFAAHLAIGAFCSYKIKQAA